MINGIKCIFFARRIRKIPYVSRLLPLHQWKKVTVNRARDMTRRASTDVLVSVIRSGF